MCVLWPVAESSQNNKQKAKLDKIDGKIHLSFLDNYDLDIEK